MNWELARLIAGQIRVHCMAGMRMAAPLLALREGYSAAAVGVLLALFALTQVFLALPAGRFADRHGLKRPVGWPAVASAGAALALLPVFRCCSAALMTATGAATIALRAMAAPGTTPRSSRRVQLAGHRPAVSNFIGPLAPASRRSTMPAAAQAAWKATARHLR